MIIVYRARGENSYRTVIDAEPGCIVWFTSAFSGRRYHTHRVKSKALEMAAVETHQLSGHLELQPKVDYD